MRRLETSHGRRDFFLHSRDATRVQVVCVHIPKYVPESAEFVHALGIKLEFRFQSFKEDNVRAYTGPFLRRVCDF